MSGPPVNRKSQIINLVFFLWGGALGFVAGAAVAALAARQAGWWPPGRRRLLKFIDAGHNNEV